MMPKPVGKLDKATLILAIIMVLPVAWFALILAPIMAADVNLAGLLDGLNAALANPMKLQWVEQSPKYLFLFVGLYAVCIMAWIVTRRRLRPLEEYGSAQWGDVKQITRKYADRDDTANLLLTQNFKLGLNSHVHRRNLNVLVVGGSGAGKTRFYAKPNILQGNTSFVCTDPKGELCRDTGNLMKKLGYDVKVIDLINMNQSYGYNPLQYITSDNDVLRLVTNLIRNTTPKNANSNDPFWEKSETALLQALILYLIHEAPPEERNFGMVMEMLQAMEVKEEDEEYQSDLDILFESLAMRNPEHIAVKQYNIYKMASGKTAKSILVSVGVRLATFNLSDVVRMTSVDEMDIPSIGKKKTIVYCCIPDNDSSFNYLIGMFYTGNPPTLQNFHQELLKQEEPEAREIALALELFTKGSLNTFAQQTNVDTMNRIVCYDIHELGKQLKPLGMLVVLDAIYNRISRNRELKRNTWIYIDEIYLLFQNDYSANFLFELWKRVRKCGAFATGISQNLEDMLQSHTARTMLGNSEFLILLNQAASDRVELARLLSISDTQLSHITNAGVGKGLIRCSGNIVPFESQFPKDSQLYKLMTTKLEETIEDEKKEEDEPYGNQRRRKY